MLSEGCIAKILSSGQGRGFEDDAKWLMLAVTTRGVVSTFNGARGAIKTLRARGLQRTQAPPLPACDAHEFCTVFGCIQEELEKAQLEAAAKHRERMEGVKDVASGRGLQQRRVNDGRSVPNGTLNGLTFLAKRCLVDMPFIPKNEQLLALTTFRSFNCHLLSVHDVVSLECAGLYHSSKFVRGISYGLVDMALASDRSKQSENLDRFETRTDHATERDFCYGVTNYRKNPGGSRKMTPCVRIGIRTVSCAARS